MTPELKEKIERRRRALYLAVKHERPDLYEAAVRVGHMALIDFGGANELARSAAVEIAAMDLVARAAGIDV